jgi:hypothetical protein
MICVSVTISLGHHQDLLVAANACPELKAFLNTILTLCQAPAIA